MKRGLIAFCIILFSGCKSTLHDIRMFADGFVCGDEKSRSWPEYKYRRDKNMKSAEELETGEFKELYDKDNKEATP